MYALSAADLFFKWQPGTFATMMRVHHPLPEVDIEVSPSAQFGGYSPALTPDGVVAADDAINRFLTVLSGPLEQRWHIDINNSLGVPSTDSTMIFTGIGGLGATRAIAGIDIGSSAVTWLYPAQPPKPDPQRITSIINPKTVSIPEYSTERFRQIRSDIVKVNVDYHDEQVPVAVPRPVSNEPFQHWSNSGLVVVGGRVFGEVNHSVVALDQKSGALKWTVDLPEKSAVRSIVATPDHLVLCVSNAVDGKRQPVWAVKKPESDTFLLALKLEDGHEEWRQKVPMPGNLALANGLLFFTDGALHVYAH